MIDRRTATLRSPAVAGKRAVFRYRNDAAREVLFRADSTQGRALPMKRAGDLWVLSREYPRDARDEYLFEVDGEPILDPSNPLRAPGGFGPRSECRMPGYTAPRPVELPVDGKMERRHWAGRDVDVYVPARVHGAAVLVVQDGWDYIWYGALPGLLDHLIATGAIPPALAVFISPINRDAEYTPNDEYVWWLADELMPAVAAQYPIDADPGRHGLIGASLGGSIATYGVLRRPDAFRLGGAQSPAYRVEAHAHGTLGVPGEVDGTGLRFHVDGGRFEQMLHGIDFLPYVRSGVDALRERGCAVQYTEVNEGHNYTNWRGRLPSLLTWLLA